MQELNEALDSLKRVPKPLALIQYPDPALNVVSDVIASGITGDQGLQDFLDDMAFTLKIYRAVGLSAVQAGVPIRAMVIRGENSEPIKLLNPMVKETDGSSFLKEGCLSFPGLALMIKRPEEVAVEYFDEKGEFKTSVFDGLLARVISHEMEHLNGKTFLDNLHPIQKSDALKKIKVLKRKAG
jgi:peptide deformylase